MERRTERTECATMEIEKPGISNPNKKSDFTSQTKNDQKETKKIATGFAFCEVCKLNHDHGQRHKYFPSHKKSLSIVFSKLKSKLIDIRFFLKNPSTIRPEHASRNRLWCLFCDRDFDEIGSSLACENIITHLASIDHLKNLKHFLWKHGGDSGLVDKFRITDDEFSKWKRKYKSMKKEEARCSEASHGLVVEPSNDIHSEFGRVNTNSYLDDNNNNNSSSNAFHVNSTLSNCVVPLQYNTNEYQKSGSEHVEVANRGLRLENARSSSPSEKHFGTDSLKFKGSTGFQNQNCAQNFALGSAGGNVHTGALPPWLQSNELSQLNKGTQAVLDSFVSGPSQPGKSKKLNPKRVGAAWAERRKIEMELEKRGELVKREFDANWLPDFGRVWQSGTRKESRKEFESGKNSLPEVETQSPKPVRIQPYISKQSLIKVETPASESDNTQHCVDKQISPKVETSPPEPVKIQPYVSKRMLRDASK